MSRRRRSSRVDDGMVKAEVVCSGGRSEPHERYRIARVRVRPSGDREMPWVVRVEYIHDDDHRRDAESDAVRTDHMTRVFACSICRRNRPLRDDKIGPLIVAAKELLGMRRVDIGRMP